MARTKEALRCTDIVCLEKNNLRGERRKTDWTKAAKKRKVIADRWPGYVKFDELHRYSKNDGRDFPYESPKTKYSYHHKNTKVIPRSLCSYHGYFNPSVRDLRNVYDGKFKRIISREQKLLINVEADEVAEIL